MIVVQTGSETGSVRVHWGQDRVTQGSLESRQGHSEFIGVTDRVSQSSLLACTVEPHSV